MKVRPPANARSRHRLLLVIGLILLLLPLAWLGSKYSHRDARFIKHLKEAGVDEYPPSLSAVLPESIEQRLPNSWQPGFMRVEGVRLFDEKTISKATTDFSKLRDLRSVNIYRPQGELARTPYDFTGCGALSSMNAYSGVGVPILKGCWSLDHFALWEWRDLNGLPDFSDSPLLQSLRLDRCRFSSLDGLVAPALEELDLQGGFDWPNLNRFPRLKKLALIGWKESPLVANSAPWYLPQLHTLSLYHVRGNLPSFSGMPSLLRIEIKHSEMETLLSLASCRGLVWISLKDSKLRRLPALPSSVKELTVESDVLKDISSLKGLSLEKLDLARPSWSEAWKEGPAVEGWEDVEVTEYLSLKNVAMPGGLFPASVITPTCGRVDFRFVALNEQPDLSGTRIRSLTLSRTGLDRIRGDLLPDTLVSLSLEGMQEVDWAGLPRGLKNLSVDGAGGLSEIAWADLPPALERLELARTTHLDSPIAEIRLVHLKQLELNHSPVAAGWRVVSPLLEEVKVWGEDYSEWPIIEGPSKPVLMRSAFNNQLPSLVHRLGNQTVVP